MSSREIAQGVLTLTGNNARGRKLMAYHTRRASKALRELVTGKVARQATDERSNVVWFSVREQRRPA